VSSVVLDATALCAVLFKEPGHEAVLPYLGDAYLSTVNLAEVLTKALDKKKAFDKSQALITGFPIQVVPFDGPQAVFAAAIREETRALGLSLGDRACLALGMMQQMPVVTSDGDWSLAGIDVKVIVFR
jgi:ribonuclease VapC